MASPKQTNLDTGEEQVNNETKPKEDVEESIAIQSSNAPAAETWTIIDKEEIETDIDKDDTKMARHEKKNSESSRGESDSDSIEVISEDEFVASTATTSSTFSLGETSMLNDSFSFPSPATPSDSISFPSQSSPTSSKSSDSLSFPSLISQQSSVESILSDGIPIEDSDRNDQLEQPLYVWNNDQQIQLGMEIGQGEQEIPDLVSSDDDDEEGEIEQVNPAHIFLENDDPVQEMEHGEGHEIDEIFGQDFELQNPDNLLDNDHVQELDRGEPGFDLDDDGLPVAQLLPREQNGDLYPSQELDEGFPLIERGEVYKHSRNRSLNFLLSGMLVVVLAMVVGLGVGHFLGLTERMEVVEMYDIIQEEKLETITDELVDCITGEEGMGGDDQELDERVIRQLRNENEELRDQLQQLKSNVNGQGDEAMLVALKNRIKALMAANAHLEGQVARMEIRNTPKIDLPNLEHETIVTTPTIKIENNPESDQKNDKFDDEEKDQPNDEDECGPKTPIEFEDFPEIDRADTSHKQATETLKPETTLGNLINQETVNLIIGLEKKWEEIRYQLKIQENTLFSLIPKINITKQMKRIVDYDWNSKRIEGRKKGRINNARADWLFERAKFRSDIRVEERKSDWYFENKHDSSMSHFQENTRKKERTCFKDFDDSQADDKGKANKFKKSKTKDEKKEKKNEKRELKNHKKRSKYDSEKMIGKKEKIEEWNYKRKYKHESDRKKGKWGSKKDKKKYKHKSDETNENRGERGTWDSKKDKKKYDQYEPRINMPEAYLHDYQERIKKWVHNYY